jgi:hypothetical protein
LFVANEARFGAPNHIYRLEHRLATRKSIARRDTLSIKNFLHRSVASFATDGFIRAFGVAASRVFV